jgi:ABC-2 type transport system permease protein
MSRSMVLRLALKDLYFGRFLIIGSLLLGITAAVSSSLSRIAFYVGSVSLVCVLVILNIFVVSISIVNERKEKTQLFILSLPVSTSQYLRSKLLFNAVAFIGPWLLLLGVSLAVIALSALPFGLIPLLVLVFTWMLLYYCVFLAVTLVVDSTGWNTTVIVIGNVSVNFVIAFLMSQPSVAAHLGGAVAVWTPLLVTFLVIELVLSAVALALGCFFASRKRDLL